MPDSALPLALAKNVGLLFGLVTLYGVLIRRYRSRSAPGVLLGGLLFGLAAWLGMITPLSLIPGVFYDARTVVLTCGGALLAPAGAILAGAIAVTGRVLAGGAGAGVGVGTIVTSVGIGMILAQLRSQGSGGRLRGLMGWMAAATVCHGLVVLWQLRLPQPVAELFLTQVAVPLLALFIPGTIGLGVLLEALRRDHHNTAVLKAVFNADPDPLAYRGRGRWWLNEAFLQRLGGGGGAPPEGVERALAALTLDAPPTELSLAGPRGVLSFEVQRLTARGDRGLALGELFVLRDLSDTRAAEARARHLATHDRITGLMNRSALLAHIDASGAEDGALVAIDLRHLRQINQREGWPAGDRALRAVAEVLQAQVSGRGQLARGLGGEFALWCPGEAGLLRAEQLARRIRARFEQPVDIGGAPRNVTLDLGLARMEPRLSGETLFGRANRAIQWARAARKDAHPEAALCWYAPEAGAEVDQRLRILEALPGAEARGELRLVFQPVVELESRRIVGAEALVRWCHPVLGEVSPGRFVPLAEQADLMPILGDWIFDEALRHLSDWRARCGFAGVLAINVSATQLHRSGFGTRAVQRLRATALPPAQVEIELTETAVIAGDEQAVREALDAFRAGGLTLSIDDFGTGYSSLLALQRLPVRKLKIAQEFVRDMLTRQNDHEIVRATIGLAHALNLVAQAEGVETEAQAEALRALGCDLAQGYLFDRPLEAEVFLERLCA